jgi:hypothetical protein
MAPERLQDFAAPGCHEGSVELFRLIIDRTAPIKGLSTAGRAASRDGGVEPAILPVHYQRQAASAGTSLARV